MATARPIRKSDLTGEFSLQDLDQRAGLLSTTIANLRAPGLPYTGDMLRLDITSAQIKAHMPGVADCLRKLVADCETHNWKASLFHQEARPFGQEKLLLNMPSMSGKLLLV